MNRKADFLIIGAQKAGTTSLFQYVIQHPEVYFSEVKEVNYFVNDHLFAKGEKYYHSFFSRYKNQKVVGSAYVHMLPCKKCIDRVYHYNPKMKFVVMLREPVKRAISAYAYAIRNGWEDQKVTMTQAMKLENDRLLQEEYDLTYFYNGLYNKHINDWIRRFPREQFIILKQEDLQHSPQETMEQLFMFLGLPSHIIDTSKKYNVASGVHNKTLQRAMLDKRHPIRKILGSVMSQQTKVYIRSRLFPIIFNANTNKIKEPRVELNTHEKELFSSYFRKDQDDLEKNFNIRY